ncbi:MAG: hypothetical protein PHV23_03480 [Candidatus Gracilibacteria bacterium]|nr:hypothetical protein [Candidatus Gracilibacteria bacterium]
MDKKDLLKELERKGDYSIILLDEISADISKLNDYPTSKVSNKLEEVYQKIEYAKSQGINVANIEKKLLDFRILFFLNNIETKLELIKNNGNEFNTDLRLIESEYNKLIEQDGVDLELLKNSMNNLRNEVKKSKLLLKLKDYGISFGKSIYNMDEIQSEYLELKKKGVNLEEIEKILYES